MSLKTKSNGVRASNIVLRIDNQFLNRENRKGCEVKLHWKGLCEERNLYLRENAKKV